MSFETKINDDDVKFVEAALDVEKRQERIEKLSHARKRAYYTSIVVGITVIVLMSIHVATQIFDRSNINNDGLSLVTGWGLLGTLFARYLYTDLQVKFLKADAGRVGVVGG